jgi:hypothetical protein
MVVTVPKLCEYTKIYRIEYFKKMDLVVCKLLNKAVIFKVPQIPKKEKIPDKLSSSSSLLLLLLLWDWGLNSGLHTCKPGALLLEHTSSLFCSCYFGNGVSPTICLGWPHAVIILILASQLAIIICMSHQCPANK